MDKQPEALRLADELELQMYPTPYITMSAAEELRRLHSLNQELVEALKEIANETYDEWTNGARAQRIAEAALAKSRGET